MPCSSAGHSAGSSLLTLAHPGGKAAGEGPSGTPSSLWPGAGQRRRPDLVWGQQGFSEWLGRAVRGQAGGEQAGKAAVAGQGRAVPGFERPCAPLPAEQTATLLPAGERGAVLGNSFESHACPGPEEARAAGSVLGGQNLIPLRGAALLGRRQGGGVGPSLQVPKCPVPPVSALPTACPSAWSPHGEGRRGLRRERPGPPQGDGPGSPLAPEGRSACQGPREAEETRRTHWGCASPPPSHASSSRCRLRGGWG